MSHELLTDEDEAELLTQPRTGADIRGRELQQEDCKKFVAGRGGHYVHTYEEPHTSAWKRKRVRLPDGTVGWRVSRPVFEQALDDLKRGVAPNGERLDGLVVYDLDRLTRDNRHLEDAIDVVVHRRRPILDTTGSVDLLTENGRSMARVLVAMANKQSADTSRRVARKHRAMQLNGIPAGGKRPFGWQDDKRTLNLDEAAAVRFGAERILAGAPPSAVAIDWNERGILTVNGKRWTWDTVKLIYRNPRVCGLRGRGMKAYNPENDTETTWVEVVRDAEGNPVVGQWEPILTVAEWETLTAIIGSKVVPGRGKNTRKYLMTGTLRCGRDGCGTQLRAFKGRDSVNVARKHHYGCPAPSAGGCGGLSVMGPLTDELVSSAVIAKFEAEAARRPDTGVAEPWKEEPKLTKIRTDIRDLTAAWRAGQISAGRYFAILPDLEAEEKQLAGARDLWLAKTHAATARPRDIRAAWDTYALVEKRAYIEEALAAVIVHPANGRRGKIADRLQLVCVRRECRTARFTPRLVTTRNRRAAI